MPPALGFGLAIALALVSIGASLALWRKDRYIAELETELRRYRAIESVRAALTWPRLN